MLGFNDFAIACTDLQRDLFAEQFPHGFLLEVSDTQLLSPFLALDAQYNIEFPEEETDCTKTYVIGEDASVDPSGLDLGDDDLVVYDEPSHRERADYALIPLALDGMREVVIGRLPQSDVVVPKGYVSKTHLGLRLNGEQIEVRDLGSRNGSKRNGETLPVRQWLPLRDGDTLALSPQLIFRYVSSSTMYEMLCVAPNAEERKQWEA